MSSTKGLLSGAARLRNELNPDTPPEENNDSNDEQGNHLNDYGELRLPEMHGNIHVITIIGQVEGHLIMPSQNKATKYEHIIPQLVAVEQSPEIEGLLVILNTVGGDVEAGLALAEIIASMSKPTVSLVLGGGHSIGVPIAVAADYSFIAPTATMTIHPIRLTGMVVGVQQSFDYLEKMQDRIIDFVARHSHISAAQFRQMMTTTGELARDVGTVVVGEAAAECGLIDETGGLSQAMDKLRQMIEDHKASEQGQEARIDPPREKAPADKPGPIFKRPHRDWRKGEKP